MADVGLVPSLDVLSKALHVLQVPEAAIRKFQNKSHDDLSWDFTEALCDASAAIVTDWRFHPSDPLREIFLRLYSAGIKVMIEEEDEESFNPKSIYLQAAGSGSRYRVKLPKKPDLHDVVFALQSILPETVRIYALARYDGTDTYAHMVHSQATWHQVATLLGSWFSTIFRDQPAKPLFKKVGKDVKPKRDFLKKFMKQATEWLDRQRDWFDELQRQDLDLLEMKLDSPYLVAAPGENTMAPEHREKARLAWHARVTSPGRLFLLHADLWAERHGAAGLRDLWSGDLGGWRKLRLALEYFYWSVCLTLRFGPAKNQFFGLGDFGNRLALAITLQEWEIAGFFARQMLQVSRFKVSDSPLSRFLLKLYSLHDRSIFEDVATPEETYDVYGVYGVVFAAWSDRDRLASALDIACDYHTMRIGDDHEFSCEPFYALACEVLAVYRIRQEMGLETPKLDHQLLDAPWREVPERVPLVRDAMLEKLIQVINKEVPDLAAPLNLRGCGPHR